MPKIKTQKELSPNVVRLQPQRWSAKYQDILEKDISNWPKGSIAEAVGMTQSRVSIIMNSPLYKQRQEQALASKTSSVISRKVEETAQGDPVMRMWEDAKVAVAKAKLDIALDGNSEFARSSAQNDILDRIGYKAESKKITTTIEINEKIASRWDRVRDRALKLSPLQGEPTGKLTVKITE